MVKKSNLDKKIYEQAKAYRELLQKTGLAIQTMYVFGSQSKGTAHEWSDIDIAVISSDFGNDRQGERVKLMLLGQKINSAIEPHPFSPEDFDDPYYPLAKEVKKTGIKI